MPANFSYLANFAKLWNNFWSRVKPEMIIRIPARTQLQPRIWKWFKVLQQLSNLHNQSFPSKCIFPQIHILHIPAGSSIILIKPRN